MRQGLGADLQFFQRWGVGALNLSKKWIREGKENMKNKKVCDIY